MSNKTRLTFSPGFRLEAAQLVINQGHSIRDTAKRAWICLKVIQQLAIHLCCGRHEWQAIVGVALPPTSIRILMGMAIECSEL
jgi:hypothetical protein